MEFKVGQVLSGKVTGITKFGAFISLEGGKSGLCHISEIANTYVSDINEFLKVGQETQVKIIGIDDNGRINLSIKQTMPKPQNQQGKSQENDKEVQRNSQYRNFNSQNTGRQSSGYTTRQTSVQTNTAAGSNASTDSSFEEKLKQFMADSDSKISGLKQYSEKKSSRRRGR